MKGYCFWLRKRGGYLGMKKNLSEDLWLMFIMNLIKEAVVGNFWCAKHGKAAGSAAATLSQVSGGNSQRSRKWQVTHLPVSAARKSWKDHKCDEAKLNNRTLDFILGIFTSIDEGGRSIFRHQIGNWASPCQRISPPAELYWLPIYSGRSWGKLSHVFTQCKMPSLEETTWRKGQVLAQKTWHSCSISEGRAFK